MKNKCLEKYLLKSNNETNFLIDIMQATERTLIYTSFKINQQSCIRCIEVLFYSIFLYKSIFLQIKKRKPRIPSKTYKKDLNI